MGVRKGQDNFKDFRDKRGKISEDLLKKELDKASRRKTIYPTESSLIIDMADRTGLHRTTITRNPKYYRLLLSFLASQPGATTHVRNKDASPTLLQAKILDMTMENAGLANELVLAKRQSSVKKNSPASIDSGSLAHSDFSDTVMLLRAVIDSINARGEIIKVDLETGEINNMAAAPSKRLIAAGQRTAPFIKAMRVLREQEK
jgi:hypothetical protein